MIAAGCFDINEIFCLSGLVENEITTEYIKRSKEDVVYFKAFWIVNIHDADVVGIQFYGNAAAVFTYADNGSMCLSGHLNVLFKVDCK